MAICNNRKCSLGECDQPETCKAYVPVITNADRIRAMSDEELAWELMQWRAKQLQDIMESQASIQTRRKLFLTGSRSKQKENNYG